MTVYQEIWQGVNVKVYGRSSITDWSGWPDDVRDILRTWNRQRRLRFVPTSGSWMCLDCRRLCNSDGSTAADMDGARVCDDCMIDRVRQHGLRGRPETELEKTKRWMRNTQRKLAKMRYNAQQEAAYVKEMKTLLRDVLAYFEEFDTIRSDGGTSPIRERIARVLRGGKA